MSRRTKFKVLIFCGNCSTVSDYEFKRGTVLHADETYVASEYRDMVPGERQRTIRKDDRFRGALVECRFCNCARSMTIRQREEVTEIPTPARTPEPRQGEGEA